ncbi:MAG TPA: hypothetical protein VFS21_28565, partial [Roseiflexaceae bacterium]|nr:hypothetical protein [Roseiflexaceae bacterium]
LDLSSQRLGELVTSIGAVVAAVATNRDAATASAAAQQVDAYNRQLHPRELTLAEQLARRSGGRYTARQVADAMRASGNSAYGEDVTAGMIVIAQPGTITDAGAVWNLGGNGMLVQQVNSNVDPGLAAFIRANTGGANSPYTDLGSPVATTPASPRNSGPTSNGQGCITAACAAGLLPDRSDNRTLAQIDASLSRTVAGLALSPAIVGAGFALIPETLLGSVAFGATLGGGSNAAVQWTATGSVDWSEAFVATGAGAAAGGVGYGLAAGAARLINAPAIAAEQRAAGAARAENNFYREGSIADPVMPMAATGPFTPVASMTAVQADRAVAAALPSSVQIINSRPVAASNVQAIAEGYQPPYMAETSAIEVVTTTPTSFVRVFGGESSFAPASREAGGWLMRAEEIQGLTAQQIASRFSLPQVPTMVTDATIPAGVRLEVTVARDVSPYAASHGIYTGTNGGGGGVQFNLLMPPKAIPPEWFTNPRPIGGR